MKILAAATAIVLAAGLCACTTSSGDMAYNSSYDMANPPNRDNLPKVAGQPFQPGDPDAVTDNYTATNQPPLGTAGPVPIEVVQPGPAH